MTISLLCFLFVAIAIPGMEAKPLKAIDTNVRFMDLPETFDASSPYDLAWQSLHMAAAAACRGSTPTGGSGTYVNLVLARNPHGKKSCKELCSDSGKPHCDAEASIRGWDGKAIQNGQIVAEYYNYGCDRKKWGYGRNEPGADEDDIMNNDWKGAYSFCCCRKD